MGESFAARLRRLRELRELKQRELGGRAGIDSARISKYENGRLREPRVDTLAKLARALNVSVAELRGDDVSTGRRAAHSSELELLLRQVREAWNAATAEHRKEIESALGRVLREQS